MTTPKGYWRRWLLLRIETQTPVEWQDPRLSVKLTTPEELQGVLNPSVEAPRLGVGRDLGGCLDGEAARWDWSG